MSLWLCLCSAQHGGALLPASPEHFVNKQDNGWLQPLLRNVCEWLCKYHKAAQKACCYRGGRLSSEQFWHSDLQQTFGILSHLEMNKPPSCIWMKLLFCYLQPLPCYVSFRCEKWLHKRQAGEMLNAMIPQTATLFLWAMYCRENVLQKERGRDSGDFEKTLKYPCNKSANNFNGEQLKK